MRKCCIDHNAKKIHFLKRSWKIFFLAIKDMVLYCFKDENSLIVKGKFREEIKLNHAYAERAFDYAKNKFVFRLNTSDQVCILLINLIFLGNIFFELLHWKKDFQ